MNDFGEGAVTLILKSSLWRGRPAVTRVEKLHVLAGTPRPAGLWGAGVEGKTQAHVTRSLVSVWPRRSVSVCDEEGQVMTGLDDGGFTGREGFAQGGLGTFSG